MRKNALKLLEAMKLLSQGDSRNAVSKRTGISIGTLGRYWYRYLAEGNKAITEKRSYPTEFKLGIIKEIKEKNSPIPFVANKYGVPSITIHRWMAAYDKDQDGLIDKRYREQILIKNDEDTQKDYTQTRQIIKATLDKIGSSKSTYYRAIKDALGNIRPFQNPVFNTLLFDIYRCYCLLKEQTIEEKGAFVLSEKDYTTIFVTARTMMMMSKNEQALQNKAIDMVEIPEIQSFICKFIDTIHSLSVQS